MWHLVTWFGGGLDSATLTERFKIVSFGVLSKATSQLGVVRTKVWEFMSVVSPLSSQILLSLVTAWLVFWTGFACLGPRGLILWHICVGGVPCLFHHPRLCLLPPWHALTTSKGLTLLTGPVSLVGLGVLLRLGGAQPSWTIKPGSKVPLPVLSWLSAPRWEVWGLW